MKTRETKIRKKKTNSGENVGARGTGGSEKNPVLHGSWWDPRQELLPG